MPIISRTDFFRVVAGIEGVHVGTQLLEAFRHVDIEAVLRLIFLPKEERQANIYHIQYDHLFYLILFDPKGQKSYLKNIRSCNVS